MKFDFSEATRAVQTMINGFVERLPYLAVALVFFIIFFCVSKAVRAGVRALAERNRQHYNLGLVMGRLASGLIIFIGLLIAPVIAIPGFTPGQLISLLGLSSVAMASRFGTSCKIFWPGFCCFCPSRFASATRS